MSGLGLRIVLIAIGGAAGAVARYALAGLVHRFLSPHFPYGTFAVNITGCLVFGLVLGVSDERLVIGPAARAFLLIGLLGGFTTFSTYAFESFVLLREGQSVQALANLLGQVVLGLCALWAGYVAARGLL